MVFRWTGENFGRLASIGKGENWARYEDPDPSLESWLFSASLQVYSTGLPGEIVR